MRSGAAPGTKPGTGRRTTRRENAVATTNPVCAFRDVGGRADRSPCPPSVPSASLDGHRRRPARGSARHGHRQRIVRLRRKAGSAPSRPQGFFLPAGQIRRTWRRSGPIAQPAGLAVARRRPPRRCGPVPESVESRRETRRHPLSETLRRGRRPRHWSLPAPNRNETVFGRQKAWRSAASRAVRSPKSCPSAAALAADITFWRRVAAST